MVKSGDPRHPSNKATPVEDDYDDDEEEEDEYDDNGDVKQEGDLDPDSESEPESSEEDEEPAQKATVPPKGKKKRPQVSSFAHLFETFAVFF